MTTFQPLIRFHAKIIVWEKVGAMLEWTRETFASKGKSKQHVEIKGKPA
jgi:hypothetical protein